MAPPAETSAPNTVARTNAPEAYGYLLVVLEFLIKHVPFLAPYLAYDSGLMSLRNLPPHLLGLDITTLALPPRGYKPRSFAGPSLSLASFEEFKVSPPSPTELISSLHIHHAFKSAKTTPLQMIESILKNLTSANQIGQRGFLREVHVPDVLEQAEASTKRYSSGCPLSVLDGVPIVVKNEFDVKGYVTRAGSKFINGENAATQDSDVVQKLRDQGAIIIGVSNMTEVGYSPVDSFLTNPWKEGHSCGGSSSGSGGAVAAGYCPIAVGCDGGGSIRSKGEFPGAPTVALSGPIAATANDLCIAYLAMADDTAAEYPPVHVPLNFFTFSVSGLRVGVLREYNAQVYNAAITTVMERVEQELVRHGAIIVPITIPHLEQIRQAHTITIGSELASSLLSDPTGNSHMMTYSSSLNVTVVESLGVRDYIHAQKLRTHAISTLCNLFTEPNGIDLILSPTSAVTAPKLPADVRFGWNHQSLFSDVIRYAFLANFAGLPAVTCPVGLDADGLPIGVQFMGEWWSEGTLLGVAKWMEGACGGVGKRAQGWNGVSV
ncbi:hypothetical protein HDU98_010161 [Podochytrium sp. JEL0797]|nr:hypothetical protein HDU98_010161 [Podochytrium sp. JEL0797]